MSDFTRINKVNSELDKVEKRYLNDNKNVDDLRN
ncbi:Uncharacterised protein [Campylobacter ureolyticus]|nr:Uncharacterised protein [Campylobacter ureolyticus]